MNAVVICGSKNTFTLRPQNPDSNGRKEIFFCTFKGKVLKGVKSYYNPLAPGDIVETNGAQITSLVNRKNTFARFNQKGQSPQLLAANADLVVCVTTVVSPPFRPRFIDRVLFQAELSDIKAIIVCNKADMHPENKDVFLETEKRFLDYKRIGYPVFFVSSLTGEGIEELKSKIEGKTAVFTGQSGTGKSSLLNALNPGFNARTGMLNEKYNRGKHTTTQPVLVEFGNFTVIDTPGIRRFAPERVDFKDVILYFRELSLLAGKCGFGLSCTHEKEQDCRVTEAIKNGTLHEDRYTSFLRIRKEMEGIDKYPDYD